MAQWNPNTWPSFQQSWPLMQGYQAAMNMQYQPRLNDARLGLMQAQTEGQQLENQHYPEQLKLKQYLADIAMANAIARADYNKLQREKIPILQGNLADRTAALPAGQSALGTNKPLMNQFLSGLAGVMGGFSGYGADMGIPQQKTTMDNSQMGTGSLQAGMGNPNSGINSQQVPITPDDVDRAQDATMSRLIKDTTPNRVNQQKYYGKTFNNFADKITEMMPIISQYAGLEGQAKLGKDTAAALAGVYNPDYEKFNFFKTYLAPQAANELMLYLGSNHTDQQVEDMRKMIDPSLLLTNPKLYAQRWNDLVAEANTIEPTINQSLAQVSGQSPLQSPGQQKAQPSASQTPSVINVVPLGSVKMIDDEGVARAVPENQVSRMMMEGWRKA